MATLSSLLGSTFQNALAVTSVSGTGTVSGITLSGTVTSAGSLTLGGTFAAPISSINDSTTVGQNLVKLTNPSAISFLRVNADNTVSALDASTFRTAIGAGTSSTTGTVTSVSGTGTVSGLSLSGTVTTSGNITLGGTLSASIDNISDEHRIFNNMGDNHNTRTSFDATTPSYNFGWRFVQGSTNGPGADPGSQYYSLYVGLGNDYLATGAGSYGMQVAIPRNVTNPYIAIRYNESNSLAAWQKISAGYADTSGSATNVTGTVAIANGGTGATTASAALTNLGAYPSTNPNGYTSNVGTVTSVSGTGTVSGLSLSGTVTTSGNITLGGTLSVTPSNFASQTANTFLAAPNGTAGTPSFRAIVAADIPTLNQNTTGTASNVTGTVAVANGGTGVTTLAANNVILGNGTSAVQTVAPGANGNVLTSNGTTWVSSAATSGVSTGKAIAMAMIFGG